MTATESRNRIVRRKVNDCVIETVDRWHEGPGSPGGRTYLVLYRRDGSVRIDVVGSWESMVHTIDIPAREVRPPEEFAASGRTPEVIRWCVVDGREIPPGRIAWEDPADPEKFCSDDCRSEEDPKW